MAPVALEHFILLVHGEKEKGIYGCDFSLSGVIFKNISSEFSCFSEHLKDVLSLLTVTIWFQSIFWSKCSLSFHVIVSSNTSLSTLDLCLSSKVCIDHKYFRSVKFL